MRGALLIAAACVATVAIKLSILPVVEPGTDQASFARWVLEIISAPHLLPDGSSGSFLGRTMADPESLLFRALYPLYNGPLLLMTVLPLLACIALVGLVGFSVQNLVAAGVAAHVAVAVLTGWLLARSCSRGLFSGPWWAGFGMGFVLISTNPYLHWFATLGIHNLGILAVCAATLHISRDVPGRRPRWGVLVTLCLASFCHWTVPLLIVPALVLYHLGGVRAGRVSTLTNAALQLSAASVAPLVALLAIVALNALDPMTFAAFDTPRTESYLLASGRRFLGWLEYSSRALSVVGLIAGVTGLVWDCIAGKRLSFSAAVLLVHVALWSFMPGFTFNGTPSAMRTLPYGLPSLVFGIGFFAVSTWRRLDNQTSLAWRHSLQFALVGLLASGAYRLQAVDGTRAVFPDLHRTYFANAGALQAVTDSLTRLSSGAGFWTWDYDIQNKLIVMNPGLKDRLSFPGSLGTLEARLNDGSLDAYLIQRALTLRFEPGTLVVVPTASAAAATRAWASLCRHFPASCDGEELLPLTPETPESGLTQLDWQVLQARVKVAR